MYRGEQYYLWYTLFFLLFTPHLLANSIERLSVIPLSDSLLNQTLPNDKIGFIEDFEGHYHYNDLDKLPFDTLVAKNLFDIAERDFNYWVVFKLKNTNDFQKTWWLAIKANYIDGQVTKANGAQVTFKGGNLLKRSERTIPNKIRSRSYVPVTIAGGETVVVKIKIKVGGFFPFYWSTIEAGLPIYFQNDENNRLISHNFLDGIYGAVLLMFCLYSFGLLLFTRELFAFWAIVLGLSYLGYFYQFNYTWYRVGLSPVFILQACISLMHFSLLFDFLFKRTYLHTKTNFPFWDKLLLFGVYYSIFLIIVHGAYFFFFEDYINAIYTLRYSHTICYVFRIVFGIVLIKQERPLMLIYGIGLIFFNTIILMSTLINDAFADAYYVHNSLEIGVIGYVLAIIFSFSYRAADDQRQKNVMETNRMVDKIKFKELQKLDGLKSNFFANVSHELRTPLTLMLGPISSALKSKDLSNRNFTLLKLAQQSGKDLLNLIGSILDLSKMEAGKMTLAEKPTALFVYMRKMVSNFESYAQNKEVLFTFNYRAEKDLQLDLDQEKLEVILNNLLSNAIKFTPKGGQINVEVIDESNALKLIVKDSGRGIHSDDLPKIFNRFFQTSQSNLATEGGTGIGLALSQEFAKLMGGEIWVESEWNMGSTFFVKLPRKEVIQMMPESDWVDISQPASKKLNLVEKEIENAEVIIHDKKSLLIVEDNYGLRDYLKTILSAHYQVQTAKDGIEALDLLSAIYKEKTEANQATTFPQLIISDIMMPRMDGFQLLTALKQQDTFRHIPVIMLTARADIQDKLKALRIGVDDYLTKPFVEEELLARIENILSNTHQRLSFTKEITKKEVIPVPAISKEDYDWLADVEKLVHEKLADSSFSVTKMAQAFFVSERTLLRRLKKLTGLTPNQYLQEIRFNEARKILEQQQFSSISKVVESVGFTDVSSFSKRYKKRFGKLPSDY